MSLDYTVFSRGIILFRLETTCFAENSQNETKIHFHVIFGVRMHKQSQSRYIKWILIAVAIAIPTYLLVMPQGSSGTTKLVGRAQTNHLAHSNRLYCTLDQAKQKAALFDSKLDSGEIFGCVGEEKWMRALYATSPSSTKVIRPLFFVFNASLRL
jgi:hypothetical protein